MQVAYYSFSTPGIVVTHLLKNRISELPLAAASIKGMGKVGVGIIRLDISSSLFGLGGLLILMLSFSFEVAFSHDFNSLPPFLFKYSVIDN